MDDAAFCSPARSFLWKSLGEDRAVIGLLTGRSVKDVTQLYYANLTVMRLETAWQMVLGDWMGNSAGQGVVHPLQKARRVGSRLAPSRKSSAAFFDDLQARMQATRCKAARDVTALPDRVAALTDWAACSLNFATARRPHFWAFDPLDQIVGQNMPRVRVMDKGNRQVDDARWLPLPDQAVQVLAVWRMELTDIRDSGVRMLNPGLCARIDQALDGTAPPFFVWPSLHEGVQDLQAADLWDRADTPANMPRNWARHYMRRHLADHGVSGAAIDAFMGHGGTQSNPMTPTNCAALTDQAKLHAALTHICAEVLSLPQKDTRGE